MFDVFNILAPITTLKSWEGAVKSRAAILTTWDRNWTYGTMVSISEITVSQLTEKYESYVAINGTKLYINNLQHIFKLPNRWHEYRKYPWPWCNTRTMSTRMLQKNWELNSQSNSTWTALPLLSWRHGLPVRSCVLQRYATDKEAEGVYRVVARPYKPNIQEVLTILLCWIAVNSVTAVGGLISELQQIMTPATPFNATAVDCGCVLPSL